MVLQSIIIPKSKYSRAQADAWIKKNNYILKFHGKRDESANYFRYRQREPEKGAHYKIVNLPGGIKLVEIINY